MRRINALTKEAICWSRSQVVASRERLELWEQIGGPDSYKELVEINEALVDGFRNTLSNLIAIEVREVADEFGITAEQAHEQGSAFPHLQGTEVDLPESIVEYCGEILDDITELYTVPAVAIADELEEWLSELYDWHLDQYRHGKKRGNGLTGI